MSVFLCGNTGTLNRGCEAIIRSTVSLLPLQTGEVFLSTKTRRDDNDLAKELGVHLVPYQNYPSIIQRTACSLIRRLTPYSSCGYRYIGKQIMSLIEENDLCLTIGGDTYCYGRNLLNLGQNRFNKKHGIKSVLWCCSIDDNAIDKRILNDLKNYDYIFAREQLTYKTLITKLPEEKIIKCCDSAFFLEKKETPLPEGFLIGNTVGINLSEVVTKRSATVFDAVKGFIRYIIENTDMNVCLIPHVYNVKTESNDLSVLSAIYKEFESTRVSIVKQDLSCEELKYIISNCRFFVGARTHSVIAAYSSFVPALAIGYSVKSKGMALDIFGNTDNYVLPCEEIKSADALIRSFEYISGNEETIKSRYASFIPEYKKTLSDAVDEYIVPLLKESKTHVKSRVCKKEICTGCEACANACPVNAITMTEDEKGFLYPAIDSNICINCNLCIKVCPSLNKFKDTGKEPLTFAGYNKNEETRFNSSSGGVFSLLAEKIINDGGVVFGAGYDADFQVTHTLVSDTESLRALMGSKFTQSAVNDTYWTAKEKLESGYTVLFSGTPCQINGLYSYLGKDYKNLFTVDLICHGVPSRGVWKRYTEQLSSDYSSSLKKINFRDKSYEWRKYSLTFDFNNGSVKREVVTDSPYMRVWLKNINIRPSCCYCNSKQINRRSDITLGDFWGVDKVLPELNDNRGISAIFIHSKKGTELFDSVKDNMEIRQITFLDGIQSNPSYLNSAVPSPFSEQFYKKATASSPCRAINQFGNNNSFTNNKQKILRRLF